jgi:murein DD-endopeptidase MepM/ murein hydrolase activator NlpD
VQHLFHLNLKNVSHKPLRIRRIELELWQNGQRLALEILYEASLKKRLRPTAWIVMQDRLTIAAAHRYQGLLRRMKGDTVIAPHEAISLTHQFHLEPLALGADQLRCRVYHDQGLGEGDFPIVRYPQKTTLHLPFSGKWFLLGGHRFDEHHAEVFLKSQNFAYDFIMWGAKGSGGENNDLRQNESYLAHGQPILAAADGVVVELHDGVAENTPVGRRPSWSDLLRDPKDLAGNFVILLHQPGEYSTYMHLRPGLLVHRGQEVKQGQPLGRCGNSGNSLEPHLHFQFQDDPDLFRANGLPVQFADFTFHFAHLPLYVPVAHPLPLPLAFVVENGKAKGAIDFRQVLMQK